MTGFRRNARSCPFARPSTSILILILSSRVKILKDGQIASTYYAVLYEVGLSYRRDVWGELE